MTLDDLKDLRWKCGACNEWHTGPMLDIGYDSPYYWTKKHAEADRKARLLPSRKRERPTTFLTEDICAIDDEDFFVRGVIHLPIIGAGETFRWSVWAIAKPREFRKVFGNGRRPGAGGTGGDVFLAKHAD